MTSIISRHFVSKVVFLLLVLFTNNYSSFAKAIYAQANYSGVVDFGGVFPSIQVSWEFSDPKICYTYSGYPPYIPQTYIRERHGYYLMNGGARITANKVAINSIINNSLWFNTSGPSMIDSKILYYYSDHLAQPWEITGPCNPLAPPDYPVPFPSVACASSSITCINNPGFYLGLKLFINGLTYYGWAEFGPTSSSPNTPVLIRAAYESIPGFPITVGDTRGFWGSTDPNYNTVRGSVYYDLNSNCIKDAGELGVRNITVFTTSGGYGGYTDNNGNYEILLPSATTSFQLNIDTSLYSGINYTKTCPAPSGTLPITFTAGGKQTINNKNFAVKISGTCANLIINISSDRRRRCFRNKTLVNYGNPGNSDALNSTIKVVMPQFVIPISSVPAWNIKTGDTLIYNIGTINRLSYGQIKITDSVACESNITGLSQCTEAFISPASYCSSIAGWDFSDIYVSGVCTTDTIKTTIINNGLGSMSDSAIYNVFLDNVIIKQAKYKLDAGLSLIIPVPVQGKAFRIEAYQTSNHPEIKYRSISMEGCGNFSTQTISKDTITLLPTDVNGLKQSVSCLTIRDSYDPNDKQPSPEGIGTNHEILPNGDIEYTIRFQNTGTASAYTVVLVDTLSSNLDPGSLRVLGSSHSYILEVTGNSAPRLVWIFGGINLPTKTSNEALSHGYITYKIAQNSNLSAGTSIQNKAHIFFDYNSPVITNLVEHTITTQPYAKNLLQITAQPGNQKVCEGSASDLTLNTQGPGVVRYQWFKGITELTGETNDTLHITSTAVSDTGNYTCRLVSIIDTLYSSDIKLAFKPNTTVSFPADSLNACPGAGITAKSAVAFAASYNWFKGNTLLSGFSDSLTLQNITSTDSGYYKIQATGDCNMESDSIYLKVWTAPDILITDNPVVCADQTIDITGKFSDNNSTSGTVSFWKNQSLTIQENSPLAVSEAGTYYIKKVTNHGACTDVDSVKIEHKPLTLIQSFAATNSLCEGADATFIVTASGNGTLTYLWKKDNTDLTNNTSSYSIADAQILNQGLYKVIVSGACGQDSSEINLSVTIKPQIQTTDISTCNSSADITQSFDDNKNTTGTISYWSDLNKTQTVTSPALITQPGIYYVYKESAPSCSDIKPISVAFQNCTGLSGNNSGILVSIYPNPVSDYIIISTRNNVSIKIADQKGNIVVSRIEISKDETVRLPMTSLPSGVYHLIVSENNTFENFEIIKE
jgi:uncharacterized repeat protein (TIGR01451 family)